MKVVLFCANQLEPLLIFDASEAALRNMYYHRDPYLRLRIMSEMDDLLLSHDDAAVPMDIKVRTVTVELKKLMDAGKSGTREWFIAFLINYSTILPSPSELARLKLDLNAHFR